MIKSRRAFLRGAGNVLIALPMADFCFNPGEKGRLFAQETAINNARLVTMYFPNGADPNIWNFEKALLPVADLRSKIILLQNIANPVTQPTDDGHEQGAAALFTGAPLKDTQRGTMISIDQHLSRIIDKDTQLKKPLVTGVWRGWAGGQYRSQSWFRRSWMENGDPVQPQVKPLEIFQTIFGDQSSVEEKKLKLERQKSVLDTIVEQMKSYTGDRSNLPKGHKELLTAHLERVRALEVKVIALQKDVLSQCTVPGDMPPKFDFDGEDLLPYSEFERVYRLQIDLMVMALQCGTTHTGSLMFCCAGEEFLNPKISDKTDHGTSHYGDPDSERVYVEYRRYHASNLRYFMDKLSAAGILDQTTIVMGSEFGDGRSHVVNPQPHLIAGGGGNLKMGQVIDGSKGKHTLNDIYTTVLTALGQKTEKFGVAKYNISQITEMFKS